MCCVTASLRGTAQADYGDGYGFVPKVPENLRFGCPTFLNLGRNHAGARDDLPVEEKKPDDVSLIRTTSPNHRAGDSPWIVE